MKTRTDFVYALCVELLGVGLMVGFNVLQAGWFFEVGALAGVIGVAYTLRLATEVDYDEREYALFESHTASVMRSLCGSLLVSVAFYGWHRYEQIGHWIYIAVALVSFGWWLLIFGERMAALSRDVIDGIRKKKEA